MRSNGMSNSQRASITSRPLLNRVAESIGDLAAHAARSGGPAPRSGVIPAELVQRQVAKGAAGGRKDEPPHRCRVLARQALPDGAVLAVDGAQLAAAVARRGLSRPPAMTMASLLASATVLPASSAASVGSRPSLPTMPRHDDVDIRRAGASRPGWQSRRQSRSPRRCRKLVRLGGRQTKRGLELARPAARARSTLLPAARPTTSKAVRDGRG